MKKKFTHILFMNAIHRSLFQHIIKSSYDTYKSFRLWHLLYFIYFSPLICQRIFVQTKKKKTNRKLHPNRGRLHLSIVYKIVQQSGDKICTIFSLSLSHSFLVFDIFKCVHLPKPFNNIVLRSLCPFDCHIKLKSSFAFDIRS